MAQLTCPKCSGAMASYERNGVTVDQCQDCRGIFLDRGELERLIDAESGYYGSASDRVGDSSRASTHHGKRSKRKESFLGDLFG
jgi:Zn-finger nucleic acid-binding protein